MNDSTIWIKSKRNKASIKKVTSNETTPSNLRHLPLETFGVYMIPSESEVKSDAKSDNSRVNENVSNNGTSTSNSMSQMIAYITSVIAIFGNLANYIDAKETAVSKVIAESLSGKTNTDEDVVTIKRNLILFLNTLLSSYIGYNLYYSLFFRDLNGKRMEQFEFSVGKLKDDSSIVHFFLKYVLCTLSMMITLIKDLIPENVEKYVNVQVDVDRRIHFILLFIIVFIIISLFGGFILNSATDKTSIGMYSVMFIAYAAFTMMKDFAPDALGRVNMEAIKLKYQVVGTYTPVFIFLIFAIRMILSISMIPITAIINFIYILFRSCFTLTGFSFFYKIRAINSFISLPTKDTSQKLMENDTNHFLMKILNKVIVFLSYYMFEIIFLMVLLFGIIDYSSKMINTPKLQSIMISICSIFILIIGYIFYKRFTKFMKMISGPEEKNHTTEIPVELKSSDVIPHVPDTVIELVKQNVPVVAGLIQEPENALKLLKSEIRVPDELNSAIELVKKKVPDVTEQLKNSIAKKLFENPIANKLFENPIANKLLKNPVAATEFLENPLNAIKNIKKIIK
jgi:hypothetical protein